MDLLSPLNKGIGYAPFPQSDPVVCHSHLLDELKSFQGSRHRDALVHPALVWLDKAAIGYGGLLRSYRDLTVGRS